MNHVLQGYGQFAGTYIYDDVISSQSWEEHLQHMSEVFEKNSASWLNCEAKEVSAREKKSTLPRPYYWSTT